MPEPPSPSTVAIEHASADPDFQDDSRLLSRSPHPYHRRVPDILEPSFTLPAVRELAKESTPPTDSGTEADDEHFLKGLPAPRRLHKGLRGRNEASSGTSTPLLAPQSSLGEEGRVTPSGSKQAVFWAQPAETAVEERRKRRKVKELIRRCTELLLMGSLSLFVCANADVRSILLKSSQEIRYTFVVAAALFVNYPARLLGWAYWRGKPSRTIPLTLPSSFDPAPLIYPPVITALVSTLLAVSNPAVLLPNLILALCTLPPALVPTVSPVSNDMSLAHWALSCAPFLLLQLSGQYTGPQAEYGETTAVPTIPLETATLLYPLHYNLLQVLHALTTTSLLPSELQLLSVALINILLFPSSPQVAILKAMLWVGGLDILVSCTKPIHWGIALARVPKWRFKRPSKPVKRSNFFLWRLVPWRKMRHDLFSAPLDSSSSSSCEATEDPDDSANPISEVARGLTRVRTMNADGPSPTPTRGSELGSLSGLDSGRGQKTERVKARRHTLPGMSKQRKAQTHTQSGRKRRSASASIKAFASLTYEQAVFRKWAYASYVYLCMIVSVFIPLPTIGVKEIVMEEALHGDEPVGWALGYLFGDLQWFRWQVVSHNLGRWICLPPRPSLDLDMDELLAHGWVEHFRATFGQANTRLILCAYYIVIIFIGLVVVFSLSPICEVDTRRKVFHFMMVAMFLPTTYIDPCFVALALSIVLAAFLLLDLLRASQLPPLSKPLAYFLAPYVDGRDLRGPVVISHIFLLIGCAIPVWLSLGSLGRTGEGHLRGWEVPTREVGMVSGVVCVGLGDAAASLVGRRHGRHKWLWGGGKSLEGSVAFAIAVFLGLMAAHAWLRVGGWPITNQYADSWSTTMQKTGVCAGMASVTEAVLTGGNDNVIVPVVLWTCVKSLGV
ncbi:hypothetical protein F5Y17DRAFT_411747 [Xylariaceae sp. FL0594]|nr:hypothetical protein F5Y17DRAFT_411747 [Xylariaceae sp. FL0594]